MNLVAMQTFYHAMDHNLFNSSLITGHWNYLINSNKCPSLQISKGISDYPLRLNSQTERISEGKSIAVFKAFDTYYWLWEDISIVDCFVFVFCFEIIIDSQEILKIAQQSGVPLAQVPPETTSGVTMVGYQTRNRHRHNACVYEPPSFCLTRRSVQPPLPSGWRTTPSSPPPAALSQPHPAASPPPSLVLGNHLFVFCF